MKDRLRCEIATPQTLDISGFISTYKEAFGGPPYFEEYTDCEIYEGVIAPHMKDGVVVYATDNEISVAPYHSTALLMTYGSFSVVFPKTEDCQGRLTTRAPGICPN